MAVLFSGNKEVLQKALDSTSVGMSEVAKYGKMSNNTAKKVFNGGSVQRAKANGVINALNELGVKPPLVFEKVFTLAV